MSVSLDELLSMAVFARVVQEQSFTAAAPQLGLSKSVVSERVSSLEKRLGTRLLHRTTRKLSLTPEGEHLYERFQHVLHAADAAAEAAHAVGKRIAGKLRVTAPVYLGLSYLSDWIAEFGLQNPDVRVELNLSDKVEDLVASAYDVGIRVSAQLPDSSMKARRIGTDVRVPVAAPTYLARHPAPATPRDLVAHRCLQLAGIADEWWFKHDDEVVRARVAGPLTSNSVSAIRLATLRGLGISVLPGSMIHEDVAAGRLVPLPLVCARSELAVHLVTPHHEVTPVAVRALGDYLSTRMNALSRNAAAPARRGRAPRAGRA
jgi:DNA-binding transcriptional LysR family regulator